MSNCWLYLCGLVLLLCSVAVRGQDDASAAPDDSPAAEAAPTEAAPTAESEVDLVDAEPTVPPLAEPTAADQEDVIQSSTAAAVAIVEPAEATSQAAASVAVVEETTVVPAVAESTAPEDQSTSASPEGTTGGETEQPDDQDGTTTEITDTTGVQTATVAAVPPVATPVGDPCSNYQAVGGSHFTVEKPDGSVPCFGLFDSPSGWIRFHLKDEEDVAEIPTVPIKQDYCGVHFAFHLHLQDKQLPAANETETAEICSYLKGEVDQPCANNKAIKIHNCNDEFFVYIFPDELKDSKLCEHKGGADVCLKRPGEEIPDEYRTDITATTSLPETTESIPDYGLPRLEDLSEEQANGTLTIEYNMPEDADPQNCTGFWIGIDERFRQMIADAVNAYLSKLPEIETTTASKSFMTTHKFTTAAAMAGTGATAASTVLATTKPTPAPTEPAEFIDTVEIPETEIEQTEPIFEEPPEGPQASDNIDDDAGKGPSKRAAKEKSDEDNRVKAEEPAKYTKDDVYYVFDTPTCVNGIVQVAIVVTKIEEEPKESESKRVKRDASSGQVIPQGELDKAVGGIDKGTHQDNTGLEYVQHYQGEPREPDPQAGAVGEGHMSIWDAHMGLFIAVIVLLIICLIVIIIGILCIKCRGKKSKPEKTPLRAEEGKSSTVIENPISDEEITRGEAPMTEAPNPAYTPNGSGQHLTKSDEDNWIVPLEELSDAERERPEVENTKL